MQKDLHPSGKNPGDAWKGNNLEVGANLKKGGMHEYALRKGGYAAVRTGFKHPDDFWTINPAPYPEAHFACFPPALVEKPLKATCPKGGLVLDPFVGSGTTLFVAQKMGLWGIGIELNKDYIDLIKKRLLGDAHQQSLNPNKLEVLE